MKRKKKVGTTPAPLNDFEKEVLREISRKIPVRTEGGTEELSATAVLIRKTLATAAEGSPMAQRALLGMISSVEARKAEIIDEECKLWLDHKARTRAELDAAAKAGQDVPEPIPHPDDIDILPGEGVRFTGPVNKSELRLFRRAVEVRDALILQHALDTRMGVIPGKDSTTPGVGAALVMAVGMDKTLPKRMQLGESGFSSRYCDNSMKTKRTLQKECYREWRRLGLRVPRGTTMGPPDDLPRIFGAVNDAFEDAARPGRTSRDLDRTVFQLIRRVIPEARAGR